MPAPMVTTTLGPDSQIFRQPTSIILARWPLASSYRVWLWVMNWTLPGIRIQVSWDVRLRRWSSGSRSFERYFLSSAETILFGLFETEDEGTTIFRNVGKYSTSNTASHPRRIFCKTAVRTSHLVLTGSGIIFFYYCRFLYIKSKV
jgi:hypothetical protein